MWSEEKNQCGIRVLYTPEKRLMISYVRQYQKLISGWVGEGLIRVMRVCADVGSLIFKETNFQIMVVKL